VSQRPQKQTHLVTGSLKGSVKDPEESSLYEYKPLYHQTSLYKKILHDFDNDESEQLWKLSFDTTKRKNKRGSSDYLDLLQSSPKNTKSIGSILIQT
jgi:hypothetical protein